VTEHPGPVVSGVCRKEVCGDAELDLVTWCGWWPVTNSSAYR